MNITRYELPEHVEPDTEAERVLAIYAQVRPDVDPDDIDQRDILIEDFEDQEVFVARDDDGEVVGVTNYYYPTGKDYAYLSGIAVDKHYRGLGKVGLEMMQYLVDEARQADKLAIEGETLPTARSFYTRMGAVAVDGDRIRLDLASYDSRVRVS